MYRIGIDLGGTSIKAGVIDDAYRIIGRGTVPTNAASPLENVKEIAEAARLACADAKIAVTDATSVGIGTPGAANPDTGVVIFAGNLGMRDFPLGGELCKLIGVPVKVENDANAAALGEVKAGAAKGYDNAVVVTLCTGLGGGIIIDGGIYSGSNHYGGELGHMVIQYGGVPCTCGRKGCFEAYASVSGLIRMTREAMLRDKDSQLWQLAETPKKVDGKTAYDAMRMGDKTAESVVEAYVEHLACGITNVVSIFQPEIVLIGGAICREGDTLLVPLKKLTGQEAFGGIECKIDVCSLGNDAGIIGAACL